MDLLFISGEAPSAAHPRSLGLIAALARRGHSITLVFADEAGTTFDDLEGACRRVLPIRRRHLAEVVACEAASGSYDIAHLDRSAAGMLHTQLPLPTVLDAVVCASLRAERAQRTLGPLARAAQSARVPALRREEAGLPARYTRVVVATEEDAACLRALSGADADRQSAIHVVPCPVDLERFAPPTRLRDPATLLVDMRELSRGEATAASATLAATLPIIWAERADVRLTVLGHLPFGAAGKLAGDPRVVFTGTVHDPRGHLAAATIVVAPVETAGVLCSALEAMATGTALVGRSSLARDLGAAPGEELVVAEASHNLAWSALTLLDDAPLRGRIGRAGRRLVERGHTWERVVVALENVYEAATGSTIAEWRLEVGLAGPRASL